MIKASSIPQISRSLRRLLDMDEPGTDERELSLFAQSGSEDEIDALEERLAVEQIVIPKGQPVGCYLALLKCEKCNTSWLNTYLKSNSFGRKC